MSQSYVNLEPGTRVPKTGTYQCCFCGPGGIASMLTSIGGISNDAIQAHSRKSTRKHFREGERFDECPNCAQGTGWSLQAEAQAAEVMASAVSSSISAVPDSRPVDPHAPALVLLAGDGTERAVRPLLTKGTTFVGAGVGGANGAWVQGEGVANTHCRIETDGQTYSIVSQAAAGTSVNETKITRSALQDGDLITIGTVRMRFRRGTSPPQAPLTEAKKPEDEVRRPEEAPVQPATGEGLAPEQAQSGVKSVVLPADGSPESTGDLFTRTFAACQEQGLNQADAQILTESICQAVQIAGVSPAVRDVVIPRLIQAYIAAGSPKKADPENQSELKEVFLKGLDEASLAAPRPLNAEREGGGPQAGAIAHAACQRGEAQFRAQSIGRGDEV